MVVLRRGEFTGEVAHLTGGPSLVSAVTRGDCAVCEVLAEGVRQGPDGLLYLLTDSRDGRILRVMPAVSR